MSLALHRLAPCRFVPFGVAVCLAACTPAGQPTIVGGAPDVATSGPTAAAPTAPSSELIVFAAASLDAAFREIGTAFEAEHPGTTVTFSFAGSQTLATQINEGATADVFASANKKQMDVVVKSGAVISETHRTFARNRLVVVYPADNPGGVASLKDLGKPGLKLVLAQKSVPVGDYALQFLAKASALPDYTAAFSPTVLANVVSFEDEVRGVVTKVVLGEADAGIVYSSDISPSDAARVQRLEIPDDLNVIASYPIAPLVHAPQPVLAKEFIDFVRSPAGQTILVAHGFLSTTGNATGQAPVAGDVPVSGLVSTTLMLTTEARERRAANG